LIEALASKFLEPSDGLTTTAMRHHQSSDPEVTKLSAAMCVERGDTCLKRVTKEGRTLTYFIKVIQQPSHARACGSGAKCKIYPIRTPRNTKHDN
jgi:hypothetical protein